MSSKLQIYRNSSIPKINNGKQTLEAELVCALSVAGRMARRNSVARNIPHRILVQEGTEATSSPGGSR